MVSSGVTLVAGKVVLNAASKSVPTADLLGDSRPQPTDGRQHVEIGGAKTLLMVGIDPRPDRSGGLADSIIICYIPASHDRLYLISIPRDTRVDIPAFDNGVKRMPTARGQKINAAFSLGSTGMTGTAARAKGVQLLSKTIRETYGIPSFDGAAVVDFDGFRSVVAALGGITMNVDEEVTSIHVGFTRDGTWKMPFTEDDNGKLIAVPGVKPVVYHKGERAFTPSEALDYVRQRKLLADDDGDYGRQRHQQQFLKAVLKKITSGDTLKNPVKLVKVIKSIGDAMTIDSGGIPLEDWAFAMRGLSADNVVIVKTNGGNFHPTADRQDELLDETTLALLKSVGNGTVDSFLLAHPGLESRT